MRRAALVIVVAVVLSLTGTPATGAPTTPGPGAPGIGDPYFPLDGNGGYDVSHYNLKVRYDPASNRLTGKVKISARAAQALSRFDLDLVGLKVDSIKVNGVAANWKRSGQELQVSPRRSLSANKRFAVVVRYHGVPKLLDEPALGASGFFETEDGAVVIGQPHVAATWFPVNDHPRDKASYTVAVTVPRGVEAISNGKLVDVRRRGAWSTWRWSETAPMASYLVTATTGQFQLTQYKKGGIRYLDAIDPTLFRNPRPRTGRQYALSGGADNAYQRLTRTIAVPAAGGELTFAVTRNTEAAYDYFAVEAHTVGVDDWTTLPDRNDHSSADPGNSCFSWAEIHPFLAHYQAANEQECTPTGSTGVWNAATGASNGYEKWSVDLSAYAGKQVEVALSVITDGSVALPGAFVDDIVGPGGDGSTSFENDGDPLDGWRVAGPPAGSPGNAEDWRVTKSDTRPSVGDNASAALAKEPEAIDFLSGVLGPYPFKQAGGIVDNDPGLGFALENQTRPIYSKDFFASPAEDNDSVVVHELAHQWAGDDLAVHGWTDIWLNEAFATYMEWLWAEKQGRVIAQEYFDFYASEPAASPFWTVTVGDPGPAMLFDGAVYDRGAMTLHALRQEIGDPAFFRLLKRWTATYSGRNVRSSQFIALAEQVSGKQLDSFFQTWIYSPTKPTELDANAKTAKRQSTQLPHVKERLRRR